VTGAASGVAVTRLDGGVDFLRQLRTVEAERDTLRAQLDARDRADAERLAGESMAAGGDLWVAGVELSGLRDDAGALSANLVNEAVERVLSERPHWRRPRSGTFDGGARERSAPEPAPSFGQALKSASRP
jgi:hypothetical protein